MNDIKKHSILYISIAIIVISITFVVSYAYMTAKVIGNEDANNTKVSTGTLEVSFTTSSYIKENDMQLINAADVAKSAVHTDFSISHSKNSNVTTKYNLYLTELTISDNFKSKYFKWELLKNGTTLYRGNFTNAITEKDYLLTSSPQTLEVSKTDNYILRIWLENDLQVNQIDLTNGTFSGKVKLIASPGEYFKK